MDNQRFDLLTRAFSTFTSRRKALGIFAAMATLRGQTRDVSAAQDESGMSSCGPDQIDCEGVCVDTCCNNAHCGACGNVCPPGLTCFEGICDCPSGLCCAEGEVICNGACVATCCDNNNCGACGNVCTGGLTCFEGTCDCPSGLCPPVKLPNTGRGATGTGAGPGQWAALTMAGAAAVAAVSFRDRTSRLGTRRGEIANEDR